MTQAIDKTVVVKFQDALDMMRYCNESPDDGAPISKKFLDWYLIDGTFTIPAGVLILEDIQGNIGKNLCMSFDFTDVEYPHFKIFTYNTRYTVAEVRFEREKNLDMVNLDFIIRSYDNRNFDRLEDFFFGARSDLVKMRHELTILTKRAHKSASPKKNNAMFRKGKERIMKTFHYSMTGMFIQMCYAAQFYFIHNPPTKVISEGSTIDVGDGKKIKTTYKYTGYVKLSDKKVYTYEDRDPDAPIREYQRHIQKWTVRGHYRRVNGKLIWIEPHIKGKGEIVEQRIYGTLDEDEVNVMPKVFEVERSVPVERSEEIQITEPKERSIKIEEKENKILHKNEPKRKITTLQKILQWFADLFG